MVRRHALVTDRGFQLAQHRLRLGPAAGQRVAAAEHGLEQRAAAPQLDRFLVRGDGLVVPALLRIGEPERPVRRPVVRVQLQRAAVLLDLRLVLLAEVEEQAGVGVDRERERVRARQSSGRTKKA